MAQDMDLSSVESILARLKSLEEKATSVSKPTQMSSICRKEFDIYGFHYNKLNEALKQVEDMSDHHTKILQDLNARIRNLEHRPSLAVQTQDPPAGMGDRESSFDEKFNKAEKLLLEILATRSPLDNISTSDLAGLLAKRLGRGEIISVEAREELLNLVAADPFGNSDGTLPASTKRMQQKRTRQASDLQSSDDERTKRCKHGESSQPYSNPAKRPREPRTEPQTAKAATSPKVNDLPQARKRTPFTSRKSWRTTTKQTPDTSRRRLRQGSEEEEEGEADEEQETPRRSTRTPKQTERAKDFLTWKQVKDRRKQDRS